MHFEMSSEQSAPKAADTPTSVVSFKRLCNDSSVFHDFGHFNMSDVSYAEATTHMKFRLSTPSVFTLQMPEDVFDMYDYSIDL